MRLRLGTLLTACLIGLSGCAGGGDEAQKAVTTAGPDSGDLMVHGVVSRNHKPVRDAEVWFELMPENLDDVKEGEAIDMWGSKHVRTDREGRYALRLDPDTLTSKYFSDDYLNFDLYLTHDGQMADWSSTVFLIRDEVWRSDEQALVGDPALKMSLDVGTSKITLTDSRGDSETSDLPLMRTSRR